MDRRFMMLESKLCKELELLEEKYRNGAEMSEGDLRRIDLLAHSLKSICCYVDKRSEQSMMDMSGRRSYMSGDRMYTVNARDGYYPNDMSREMGRDMSGHYPYYPEERRW